MRDGKGRAVNSSRQAISRIPARQAAKIFKRCDQLLEESKLIFANFSRSGFGHFLALLSDDILSLAVQPDSWGQRVRARLMSDLAPALQGDADGDHGVSIEDIVYCSNIVTPCLLLELGRRFGHLDIDFPPDPTNSQANSKLRTGTTSRVHFINTGELLTLVASCGPDLVALCYFGNQESRQRVEAKLEFAPRRSGVRPSKPN